MNKYIALLLAIILSLSLFSCLSARNQTADSLESDDTAPHVTTHAEDTTANDTLTTDTIAEDTTPRADLTDVIWLDQPFGTSSFVQACCDYYSDTLLLSIYRRLQRNYADEDRICLGVIVNKDGRDVRQKIPTNSNASNEYNTLLTNLAKEKMKEINPELLDHMERATLGPAKNENPYEMSEKEANEYQRVLAKCKQLVLEEGNEELEKLEKASEEHSEALQKYLRDNMAEYVGMKEYFAELGFEIAYDYTEDKNLASFYCSFAIVGTKAQIMDYIADGYGHNYHAGYCEEKDVYFYLVPIPAPKR